MVILKLAKKSYWKDKNIDEEIVLEDNNKESKVSNKKTKKRKGISKFLKEFNSSI